MSTNQLDHPNSASRLPSALCSSSQVACLQGTRFPHHQSALIPSQSDTRSHGPRRTPPSRPRHILGRPGRKEERPEGCVAPFSLTSFPHPLSLESHAQGPPLGPRRQCSFFSRVPCSHAHRSSSLPTSYVHVAVFSHVSSPFSDRQ